jgi:CheY-like chemotaxis protein
MECFAETVPGRILLIEDDPRASVLIAAMMQRHGFEVALAASGYEALSAARAAEHDVILIDMDLPDMTGAELASRLRADPATARTPLVAITADPTPAVRARALAAGCDAFFAKGQDMAGFCAGVIATVSRRVSAGYILMTPSSHRVVTPQATPTAA